jgi:hypothetical protein
MGRGKEGGGRGEGEGGRGKGEGGREEGKDCGMGLTRREWSVSRMQSE